MIMLSKAWNAVSNTTFTNCFKKAGISEEAAESALNDEDDPCAGLEEEDSLKTLESDLVYLKEKFGEQIDTDITLDEYIDFDHDVSTTHGKLSDREILAEIIGRQEEDSDEDEDENDDGEPIVKPGIEQAREAIRILEDFSLFSQFGEAMLRSLKEINRVVLTKEQCTKKQVPITDFFKEINCST